MGKSFFNKFTKKDAFYIALILIIVLVFSAYNLRKRVLETRAGQQLASIVKIIFPSNRQLLLQNVSYPQPSTELSLDELKDLITLEVPVMSEANVTDFEKVSALREWVFDNIPTADSKLILDNLSSISPNDIPLTTRVSIFREGLAAAWCGTTASTLREIYDLFGYESYTVNLGNSSIADTHVITLVKIFHKGNWIFNVQGAYLNNTIVDKNGDPLGYFGALALLRAKQDDEVFYKWSGKNGREEKPYLVEESSNSENIVKVFPNNRILQEQKFEGYYDLLERIKPILIAHNYPTDLIYLNLFPFDLHGNNYKRAEVLLSIAKSISGTFCENQEKCDPKDIL